MTTPERLSKLRMAPPPPPEDLGMRVMREKRAAELQREDQLRSALDSYRVGSVPYLNAVPLTRGLEEQIVFAPPSRLAAMLHSGELDAALVSVTEVMFHDRYDVLDGIAVACLGEVKSVFLAHRRPVADVDVVFYDPATLASLNLLKVLLMEQGLRPEFRPGLDPAESPDYMLMIGDPAIDFIRRQHDYHIWDLGTAWFELTRLPFVFAIWALKRSNENAALRRQLREAKDFGLDTLDYIISSRTEFDYEFRRDYLGWHIHYHLGQDEKRGMQRFVDLLRKHHFSPVYDPQFVF